ncbi:MAG: hypothetical protein NVS4B2_15270 [Chloroflexota bacterium]
MLHMLSLFGGRYWARVAGRDTGQPPRVNGHDEFAARWVQEMLRNLHGLPVTVIRQPFATPGFRDLPATRPGINVLVVIPGSRHPEQAVVVGSHYDGEPYSKGSAYDDTSGSIITLALARELGGEWRAHGLPSRTIEFTLFDAEEQGLVGSNAYAFSLRHGALMPRPIFMINEEQSGVGYPVRPFGLVSRAPVPSIAATTGTLPPHAARIVGPITPADPKDLALALQRVRAAGTTAFARLRSAYPRISYRGGDAPAFASSDKQNLHVGPDIPICCSDNAPFEALGLPTLTLSGDYHYYERAHAPWAFPFDQPQDTPEAMACDTGGSPRPGVALQATLGIEAVISHVLIDDYAPVAPGRRVAVFSSVPAAGDAIQFQVIGSASHADWNFGDGGIARGPSVTHAYRNAGTYTVRIRVGGNHEQTWQMEVPANRSTFSSTLLLNPPRIIPWHPAELQGIAGCR